MGLWISELWPDSSISGAIEKASGDRIVSLMLENDGVAS